MQNINLTPIIEAVIALLAALITSRLIPWLKARTTNEQQARIAAAIRTAVYAAEQIYGAGHGAQKKAYAVAYLSEHGFDVDSTAIEGAVGEFINRLEFNPHAPDDRLDDDLK